MQYHGGYHGAKRTCTADGKGCDRTDPYKARSQIISQMKKVRGIPRSVMEHPLKKVKDFLRQH